MRAELECLKCLEVICKVDEPINWVSSLAYAWKPNGKVCTHLNAKNLNNAIWWDQHRIPTIEKIMHNFAGSTVFMKVNGTAFYYCVELDEESQLLTMFNSPFGWYCFQHLPPGLTCSQDIFQKKIDHILDQCPGVIGIHRKDMHEHNMRIHHFMNITAANTFLQKHLQWMSP